MKKNILLTMLAVIFVGLSAVAEESSINAWGRKNYFNVGYGIQTLENKDNGMKWKSDIAVSLVKGTTYYLHSKPILGMIKFGIDWTQVDLNYAKLKEDFVREDIENAPSDFEEFVGKKDWGQHQLEYSMHVGPSITVNPVNYLKINAYFRYAPSFSAVLYNDANEDMQFSGAFANYFVTGGAVSWKLISLGAEYRWGSAKYKTFSFDDESVTDDIDPTDVIKTAKQKMNTSSVRFYVSLRF